MRKNRLSTSARPLEVEAISELAETEAAEVNGGMVFGLVPNPTPAPTPHHKKHHHTHKTHHPIFGLLIHP
ncbi:hypothetical protein HY251_16180 [bacterium]|nr:hypothetical protein [bacterium]